MPTIDELAPALSVSDGDDVPISQGGIARRATRAQILSGVQAELALAQGNLLGRQSAGIGGPEPISIGANLRLVQGALTASPAFSVAALPMGNSIGAADLVAVGQGGQDAALDYASFMAGLAGLSGINGSSLITQVGNGGVRARIADLLAGVVSISAFGAVGDGVTDDTVALMAALAGGQAVRFDARTYRIDGPINIDLPIALIGVPGMTILQRHAGISAGPWVGISAQLVELYGIVFDAGNLTASDGAVVRLKSGSGSSTFERCTFLNATGAVDGHGIYIDTNNTGDHEFVACVARSSAADGFSAHGSGRIRLLRCVAEMNGGSGVSAGSVGNVVVDDCRLERNYDGISIGVWQGGVPNTSGLIRIARTTAQANQRWGFAVAGVFTNITDNLALDNGSIASGGGILFRGQASRVTNNDCRGGAVGIDIRGGIQCSVAGNFVANTQTGILASAARMTRITGNILQGNGWAILVSAFAPGISAQSMSMVSVETNTIEYSLPDSGGVNVIDGAQGVLVADNAFWGSGSAVVSRALWVHSDEVVISGNSWNNTLRMNGEARPIDGVMSVIVPDIMDEVLLLSAPSPIAAILTAHQVDVLGQVTFVRVTAGGNGYTHAAISFSGIGGGAAGEAVLVAGSLAGVVMTSLGSGYGCGSEAVTVTIAGDGVGAAASANVGAPVLDGRRLRITCNSRTKFVSGDTLVSLSNWTGFSASVPAYCDVEFEGVFGGWRATAFPPADYVAPIGDGSVVFGSAAGGDIFLHPDADGVVRIGSDTEPSGYTSQVGRGSPVGVVHAAPGSDYRNLDGGAGSTMWIKQSGTDASGWHVVA